MGEQKFALVLGGGGVRCMAHVGVFLELERQGITPDLIVGSSIGSVIGGVYAYRNEAEFLKKFALRFSTNQVVRILERLLSSNPRNLLSRMASFLFFSIGFVNSFWGQGFLSLNFLKKAYKDVVGRGVLNTRKFFLEDSKIPFAALATDLVSGRAVIITHGDIPEAVYASSAMPGVCKPLVKNGMQLVDGGIISTVPVLAAHLLGAQKIVGVDTDIDIRPPRYRNSIEAIDKASTLRGYNWNRMELGLADIVISPQEIKRFSFYQFSKAYLCIEAGRAAVRAKIGEIRDLISSEVDADRVQMRIDLSRGYAHTII